MEVQAAERQAAFRSSIISVRTQHSREFIDITDLVISRLAESGIQNGLALVSSLHTTAAIVVNEHEPELLKDFHGFLHGLAPDDTDYAHNVVPCLPGEVPNGHSHCQALLLSTSASFPIIGGSIQLGRYQRVFLVELDHQRPRNISVVFLGA